MAAETARKFEALEAQASGIMEVLGRGGYEHVAPAVLQPAGIYLDAIGEELRQRTYVFTDPEGEELCLRPDLTVPTCRLYLEREPAATSAARFCYNGPCFRFQPDGRDEKRPREFRQAGLELFNAPNPEEAECEVLALVLEAVKGAGLAAFKLRLGDLGLFRALIEAIEMPPRWRRQLTQSFWRTGEFHTLLRQFCEESRPLPPGIPEELVRSIDPDDPDKAVERLVAYLAENGIAEVGVRSLAEIATHLVEVAADKRAEPLAHEAAELIEAYVGITAPPRAAGARIADLATRRNVDLGDALDAFRRRLDLMGRAGVDLGKAEFSAEFGRTLEYYTGFVFEMELPGEGRSGRIAGGGRYDGLARMVGSPRDVPAVGAAIHTERLLAVVEERSS
jgi:ATP phosphoribosyltransferase regulatory subunit